MVKIKRVARKRAVKRDGKQIIRQVVNITIPSRIGKTTTKTRGRAIQNLRKDVLMSRLQQPFIPNIFNSTNPRANVDLENLIKSRLSNLNEKLNQVVEDNAKLKAQALKLQTPVRKDDAGTFIVAGEDELARQQRLDAIVDKLNANNQVTGYYADLKGNLKRIDEISKIDRVSDALGEPIESPQLESELEDLAESSAGVGLLPSDIVQEPSISGESASSIEIRPSMPVFSATPQEPETFIEEPVVMPTTPEVEQPTFEAEPMGEVTQGGAKEEEITQPEAVKPVEEPKSVTDEDIRKAITKIEQLTKTLRKKNIGRGQLVEIYTLAGEELPDKLIRAKRQKKLEALEKLLPVLEAKLGTPQQEPKTIEERPAGFVKRPKPVINLPPTRT